MQDFKKMLVDGRYEDVLSLTKESVDPSTLFYRASAFLSLKKPKEALNVLLVHRDLLYKAMPLRTMKSTFEIRFFLKEYEEAYDDLEDFSARPYVSQEVEEFLKSAPGLIRGTERKETLAHSYSEEEIHTILRTSKDDYQVLTLLDGLKDAPLKDYNPDIVALLTSSRHPSVRSFALLLLVGEKYPEEVAFQKGNGLVHVVPSLLLPPFTGEEYRGFKANLSTFLKEPSVTSIAGKILDDAILADYPDLLVEKSEDPLLAAALCRLALDYLQSGESLEEVYAEKGLQKEEVEAKAKAISTLLSSVPPLEL